MKQLENNINHPIKSLKSRIINSIWMHVASNIYLGFSTSINNSIDNQI